MKLQFIFNTKNGHFYTCLPEQRKERCIYLDTIGKYYLNKGEKIYLDGENLKRFDKFRAKV